MSYTKHIAETWYWIKQYWKNRNLPNSHYEHFYTKSFGLDSSDYKDKSIIDIGSGPRDPLQWATMTKRRVLIDPLNWIYRLLKTPSSYAVTANAENIPFPNESFDLVTCFNSLDHVDNISSVAKELQRILKPGGKLLIIVELGHDPTTCEPHRLSSDIDKKYFPDMSVVLKAEYAFNGNVYRSIRDKRPKETENSILQIMLVKKAS